jgi:hypothetical protein
MTRFDSARARNTGDGEEHCNNELCMLHCDIGTHKIHNHLCGELVMTDKRNISRICAHEMTHVRFFLFYARETESANATI